ncbi:hypothetical protein SEUCBS139899_002022 [Sporothrix eucalyptigena]|uniref:Uncharacterized protein n=1 Tax=Sporothrix eucalyptigena TaxID=1812306 RepID=A0ABP0CBQ6_9PEZI
MSFLSAITDFVRAIYEALAGTLHLVFRIFHDAFMAVYNFIVGCFTLVADVVRSAVTLVGGVSQFVIGNFVILAILAAGAYFYLQKNPTATQTKMQSTGRKAVGADGAAGTTNGKTKKA